MIMSKKYDTILYRFVLFISLSSLLSCTTSKVYNSRIEGSKIPVTAELKDNPEMENFIAPYREHINRDLDSVLAYSPETLDKSKPIKKWQTTIGNLLADVTFEKANRLFNKQQNKSVDICLLNHGGIRAILPKGNVTTRTAFEIMPFENSLIIVALRGEQVMEIADYIAREKKPHPLSGMQIVLDNAGAVKDVTVQGRPVGRDNIYHVATSDYLSNGGDSMEFFKKGKQYYDMNYKLRNLFIDYFKEADTIPVIRTERIITE